MTFGANTSPFAGDDGELIREGNPLRGSHARSSRIPLSLKAKFMIPFPFDTKYFFGGFN